MIAEVVEWVVVVVGKKTRTRAQLFSQTRRKE